MSWTPGTGEHAGHDRHPGAGADAAATLTQHDFRPGPKQLAIVTANANGGVSSVNGITVHVRGTNGTGCNAVTYTPPVVTVDPPPRRPAPTPTPCRTRSTAPPAGSLLVLSPGVYNENVLVWKPLKLQGLGPGGIIGAHELQARDPEDPRFSVEGLGRRRPLLRPERRGLRRHRDRARAVRQRSDAPPGAARRGPHRGRPEHLGLQRPRRPTSAAPGSTPPASTASA